MRNGLIALTALLIVGGCAISTPRKYDRPDAERVLDLVRKGQALRATTTDGETLDLRTAVTAGSLVCAADLTPACFPATRVATLDSLEQGDTPWWAYAVAAPFAPVVLAGEAVEGLDRALTGGPQTFSPSWAPDAMPEYNPCIAHVRREAGGAWPSDQRILADLYRRRAELGGGCLVRMGAEYAYPVAARRRLHLTGMARRRFEAFACAQARPEAQAAAPKALVPTGGLHTEGRDVDWPRELDAILRDPATFAVTADLTEACVAAGGVAPDLSGAMVRAREGWPLPADAG